DANAERADATAATVGGGGAPGVTLPSAALSLPEPYAAALRTGPVPVVGRLEGGRCLLDLRAVPEQDDARLADAVRSARPGEESRT
ncbi:L-seryl-tRNA(Sec) selenium transferase, partial [Streptomyces sp. NPDC004059]